MGSVLSWIDGTVVGLISLVLFSFLILRRSKVGHRSEPPAVAGAWPIVGHALLLSGSQSPHKILGAMADKYGPIFAIRLGSQRALVISSWEMAKECFTTNDLAVSSRPTIVATQLMSYNQAMFGFAPYGPYWRDMRKFATSELLSNRRLESLRHLRVSEVESSVKELFKLWEEKKNDSGQVLLEMNQWFEELALNVVLRMVVGKRCFGGDADEASQNEAQRCLKVMRDFFRLLGLFVVGDALPWLRWLDLGGHEKAMKETAKEMDTVLEEWLEEHRQKRASGEVIGDEDLMYVMLSVLDGTEIAGFDTDTIHKATAFVIIASATDTTALTLTWAASLLLNNRDALKKVQDELDEHVGKERLVNESDINKLVYLQAVFKETLRLYPPGPLSGPREFIQDCTLGGYHVKAGTRLLLNLWKLHRDPRVWSDPLDFKPERFLTSHKGVDVKGQHFELLPFGSGRRSCPGISFALQMTHLALAAFLHAFEIETPFNAQVDMGSTFGLANTKTTPLEVLAKPRLSPSLYQ